MQRNGQYICLGRAQDYPDVGTFQKKAATFRLLDFFDTLRNDPEDIREYVSALPLAVCMLTAQTSEGSAANI